MIKVGVIVFLVGIPGLLFGLIPGIVLMSLGAILMVVGFFVGTGKAAGRAVGGAASMTKHAATITKCPSCKLEMPRGASVCTKCGWRAAAA